MNEIVNENIQHSIQEDFAPEDEEQVDYLYDAQDLIDEESGDPETDRATWTETALDILIATFNELRNSSHRYKFRTKKETYIYIEEKMTRNGYAFTWNQIENKLKALKRMYLRRKSLNQEIEPELSNLFEESCEVEWEEQSSEPAPKKFKHIEYTIDSPDVESVISSKAGWSEDATKVLLSLLREVKPQVGVSPTIKNKRQMWEHISNEMCNLNYNFAPTQIENKWKSLVRSYRKRNDRDGLNKSQTSNNDDDSLIDLDDPNYEDYIDETNFENQQTSQFNSNDINIGNNDNFNSDVHKIAQSSIRIANKFAQIQEETNKIATQKIKLKQMQIQAYKERTKEIKQIGSHLSELVQHFTRKENY